MPYITREDGEHFVIPSYRDVMMARNKSTLKKEILLLSQNYGEYITLQRKNPTQYEVAFSPDTGYLLGESIWQYFKKPTDMIYCEAIPNTTEAILVIVKEGSVYLDGSFPQESIPEELVIFLTQQNAFEIYTYGDVAISQIPEEGKFAFETTSVKSFSILDNPVFQTLPLYKQYQLQLVDPVLKAHGIGVLPIKQVIFLIVLVGLGWMMYSYLIKEKPQVVSQILEPEKNPYADFNKALISPKPEEEISYVVDKLRVLMTMPGWTMNALDYSNKKLSVSVTSGGSDVASLEDWVKNNNATIEIRQDGIYVIMLFSGSNRLMPKNIYPIKDVIATLIDRLGNVYPGNNMQISTFNNKGAYTDVSITVNFMNGSPTMLSLIGSQFKDLPCVLKSMAFTVTNGNITGSIIIQALGN